MSVSIATIRNMLAPPGNVSAWPGSVRSAKDSRLPAAREDSQVPDEHSGAAKSRETQVGTRGEAARTGHSDLREAVDRHSGLGNRTRPYDRRQSKLQEADPTAGRQSTPPEVPQAPATNVGIQTRRAVSSKLESDSRQQPARLVAGNEAENTGTVADVTARDPEILIDMLA